MASGTVKWFNSAKGYGFICPEEGGQDVFAHFSAIVMEGYKSLKAGEPVSFEVSKGPKGLQAADIRSLGEPPEGYEADPNAEAEHASNREVEIA